METIESSIPNDSINFVAECNLSTLSESNVKRLSHNNFKAVMPGIESWFGYGYKSKTGTNEGLDKVKQVAEHVNMIQSYIPHVQTNFLLGLDCDSDDESFSLTKQFVNLAPAAYPAFALMSVFGKASKKNVKYENEKRIIPFPFHYMMSVHTLNITPNNYSWFEFYQKYINLLEHCFSAKSITKRFNANNFTSSKWITLLLSLLLVGKEK